MPKQDFKILKGPSEEEQEKELNNLNSDKILLKAAKYGSLKWVKEALKRGANIHHWDDWTLQLACNKGHLDIVKFLLDNGANLKTIQYTGLQYSLLNGHFKVAKLLLDRGADLFALHENFLNFILKYQGEEKYEKIKKFINKCKIRKYINKKQNGRNT